MPVESPRRRQRKGMQVRAVGLESCTPTGNPPGQLPRLGGTKHYVEADIPPKCAQRKFMTPFIPPGLQTRILVLMRHKMNEAQALLSESFLAQEGDKDTQATIILDRL